MSDFSDVIEKGSLFHTFGAENEKLLSPSFLKFVILGFRRTFEEDLRFLAGTYNSTKELKYDGAKPLIHLKVNKAILKSILYCTGNQCNSIRHGVT